MDYETPQFYRVMQYAAEADRDVVDMVSGSPDWGPPPAVRDGLRAYADLDAEAYGYPPSPGIPTLREEIAKRRDVPTEAVLVTNGAGEANHLATATALDERDGDEVLVTDPVYPYYAGRASVLGAEPRFVPTDEDGHLDPDVVRETANGDTAAIVVTTPNNPTGAVYGAKTMAELVAIAEDNGAVLISDEVYDHFDYSGRFASVLDVDSPARIVTNSFSKTLSVTGLRIGYIVITDEQLRERAQTRHMLTNVAVSRPAQYAVAHALQNTTPEWYANNRQRVRDRIERFTDTLETIGADYLDPEGAFYVMARIDGLDGSIDAAFDLIDTAGISAMPGSAFGETKADWLRFSLLTPRIAEASRRLEAFVASED
ncbi:pyridoxal phosphate-dependent aminotransferase [Halorhabdus sp. CBA1104]|uniref:pyridoxal phosphate-dependent aminotransferase n=1 Tax=Halorhabdus sp. CBA1104 TaxID=1380432 RepID=UPI0012B2F967|nr:pyridoxal phosphate-dependent aminotransferase [Halorhabdus sp. CBA1104]QGN07230.1 pyridoxal phosphate-dependent aminotransferase [Halorhabdus sp. CBA1104]